MDEKRKEKASVKVSGIVALLLCLAFVACIVVMVFVVKNNKSDSKEAAGKESLSLWTEDSVPRNDIISYVEAVTDEESPDYIPVEDRIAVFDFDGTLFCETDPNYFDYTMLLYRVTEDPDYKDKASDAEKEVAQKIITMNETGESAKGLEVDHGKAVASAFAGMTMDEFSDYIQEFKKHSMPSYNLTYGDGFYLPMLEVVKYLQENDFTIYVISGTDRLILRGVIKNSPLNVRPDHIIGSDESIIARHQGTEDGMEYIYTNTDDLVLGGTFLEKDIKMNKVSNIMQEIGQQPVLSFGNSAGDYSMAEYVITNNKYRSQAFMLCCDDTVRENGKPDKADKMYQSCSENGWTPISMKNDWTTIYDTEKKQD
ncbi:MAG: haloacid dehalogenase-like hydrolase [Eubacterium sp.]|nr:haloacid dehalogenase-like hydrolase [Eubacterium sp.]